MCGRFAQLLLGGLASSSYLLGCHRPDDVIATLKTIDVPVSPCALPAGQSSALSRFDFEDAAGAVALRDAHGLSAAELVGGSFVPAAGPEGCGTALGFDNASLMAEILNMPAWDLDAGSVDFWVRMPNVAGTYGVLGRDQVGTDLPGHLSFWITPDSTITARLQGATVHATHCTDRALAPGQWAHVGFNFGPPGSELYVDGQLATRTGDSRVETVVPECGGTTSEGIAGNEQPWILGFDTSRLGDGLEGLLSHFTGGAIDAFQISAARRDFRAP
jgi:hypothetical protein